MNDTITQRKKTLTVFLGEDERTITIRRFTWKAQEEFLKHLGEFVLSLMQVGAKPAGQNGEPVLEDLVSIVDVIEKLPKYLTQSSALVKELLTNCSDLRETEIDEMQAVDVFAAVEAAVALNLDDKVKNCCAGIVASVRGFWTPKK